jgi:flagellar biosynthesis protein FlhB
MAHDEAGDKTEQPTARRREEAREEGQIARSSDLTAAVALLAGLLLLKAFGGQILETLFGMTRAQIGRAHV